RRQRGGPAAGPIARASLLSLRDPYASCVQATREPLVAARPGGILRPGHRAIGDGAALTTNRGPTRKTSRSLGDCLGKGASYSIEGSARPALGFRGTPRVGRVNSTAGAGQLFRIPVSG